MIKLSFALLFGLKAIFTVQIGMIYLMQRMWEQALENYQTPIQWDEKTGNHVELGGTYHQIGRVYEEQHLFDQAFDSYWVGFEISVKTDSNDASIYNFNSMRQIVSKLSKKKIQNLKEILPTDLFQKVFEDKMNLSLQRNLD